MQLKYLKVFVDGTNWSMAINALFWVFEISLNSFEVYFLVSI